MLVTTSPARPPLGRHLAYRVLDVRLPERYQDWVRADIQDERFWLRWLAGRWVLIVVTVELTMAAMWAVTGWISPTTWWQFPLFTPVVLVGMGALMRKSYAREAWRRHVGAGG